MIIFYAGSTTEIGRNLLQAGADPSVGNCLQSVLNNSELRKITELILELLQKGANPNIYSRDGSNLIDVTKKGTKQLVEELLRYGADVNVVDYEAKSALHYACECKIGILFIIFKISRNNKQKREYFKDIEIHIF